MVLVFPAAVYSAKAYCSKRLMPSSATAFFQLVVLHCGCLLHDLGLVLLDRLSQLGDKSSNLHKFSRRIYICSNFRTSSPLRSQSKCPDMVKQQAVELAVRMVMVDEVQVGGRNCGTTVTSE
jgi:hypothetical protein